jgi:hypothetical protein
MLEEPILNGCGVRSGVLLPNSRKWSKAVSDWAHAGNIKSSEAQSRASESQSPGPIEESTRFGVGKN